MRRALAAILLGALLVSAPAAAGGPRQVEVTGPRVTLGDVLREAPAESRAVDLGPAPQPGASRVVTRDEIARSLPGASRAALPDGVRVVRKMQRLGAAEIERLTRQAMASLPRGVALGAVRGPASVDVAAGFTSARVALPRLPRRTGALPLAVTLELAQGGVVLQSVSVRVDLVLGPEAAVPDVVHGSAIAVFIQRGLVEISAPATATADGDVGDVIAVTVRATGRTLRARIESKDRAVAVDAGGEAPPTRSP